ncbi:MAG: ABC transporter permease [Chloroflexi bacterium]|nr:ABC transporter permease [Chloroflexota bacterium]
MNLPLHAIRAGLSRGVTQFLQILLSREGSANAIIFSSIPLVVFVLMGDARVGDTAVPLAVFAMPGAVAAMIAFGAVLNPAYYLSFEREDGTLLRMRSVPSGMVGYVIGRVTQDAFDTLVGVAIVLVGGLVLLSGVSLGGLTDVLVLGALIVLGLLAMIPIGLIIGSLIRNPRFVFGIGVIVLAVLAVISGIWFPIQELPGWLAAIAQVFPIYWLGLGMRSVFLPEAAVALEVDGSWRPLETFAVLGAWTVAGLVAAPTILRRMAARESGSAVEGARTRALQRG